MKQAKKIAILADFPLWMIDASIPKKQGHYATWLVNLYELLGLQDRWDIHWVVLVQGLSLRQREGRVVAHGQCFHLLPRARKMIGLYSCYLHDRLRIAHCLAGISPDLVHAWGTEDCYALAGADFKGHKLLSIQGLLSRCVRLSPMDKFTRRHSCYEPRALRHYAHITGESPYALQHLAPLAPHANLQQLEYAVDDIFYRLTRQLSTRPSFLYAGTMTTRKNVQLLLDAFASPELRDVQLYLAGVSLDKMPPASQNVTPLGRLDRANLCHQMTQSWGLLCPSLTETGPTIVKEARVAGLPVILSTECGSKQYIQQGQSGFIINAHDKAAMIQHVLYHCTSAEHNKRMGQEGQSACRRALSKEIMLARLGEIYDQILA